MVNKTDFQKKLDELQRWFVENPKLPQEIDPLLLKRFLKCMYGDEEETKKLIELNYMLRNKHSHIFLNRDPEDENVKRVREACELVVLPGLTPKRHKLLCFRIVDRDARKMDSVEECKIFFMIADCRYTMADIVPQADVEKTVVSDDTNEDGDDALEDMADGEVHIVDIGNYTMGHIARISFKTLRIYMKYLQEAYPVRMRAMHIINCPSYLDKMIAIVKPFIADEVYKMIHFHTNGLESLYDHVPRNMLPEEYGGNAGKMSDIKEQWTHILNEKRSYLMDPKHWKIEQTESRSGWWWF